MAPRVLALREKNSTANLLLDGRKRYITSFPSESETYYAAQRGGKEYDFETNGSGCRAKRETRVEIPGPSTQEGRKKR